MSPRDFALSVGVTRKTVYRWIWQGKLKVKRIGDRHIDIPWDESNRVIAEYVKHERPKREKKVEEVKQETGEKIEEVEPARAEIPAAFEGDLGPDTESDSMEQGNERLDVDNVLPDATGGSTNAGIDDGDEQPPYVALPIYATLCSRWKAPENSYKLLGPAPEGERIEPFLIRRFREVYGGRNVPATS